MAWHSDTAARVLSPLLACLVVQSQRPLCCQVLVTLHHLSSHILGDKAEGLTRLPSSIDGFLHCVKRSPLWHNFHGWFRLCFSRDPIQLIRNSVKARKLRGRNLLVLLPTLVLATALLSAFLRRERWNADAFHGHIGTCIRKGTNIVLCHCLHDGFASTFIHGEGAVGWLQVRWDCAWTESLKSLLFGIAGDLLVNDFAETSQVGFHSVNLDDPFCDWLFSHSLEGTSTDVTTLHNVTTPCIAGAAG
mmetsp:Transcript_18971/g.52696  ORF Transcript_18971/g.52696 Transcript_18971/m.52696 type:complete len:247 (-) Transcript_18971:235-975(-)